MVDPIAMTPEKWQQIKDILEEARELPADERTIFLDNACKDDKELRGEIDSLLEAHFQVSDFIEDSPADLAEQLLEDDLNESLIGQKLSHYQILSRIGKGGMGEVYLAFDERLSRKVAIKLLPSSFTKDLNRVRRFEQEARAASALNHPNILTIFDIGHFEELYFIATEFVEGQTLRALLQQKRLKPLDVVNIATQIANALVATHQAGIVHRDVKPENIMIRPDGIVKVLDFGLAKLSESLKAKAANASSFAKAKTGAGTILGTVNYMSPEQARGQEADARADLFSLGVVIYELLTGATPFTGKTPNDCIASILKDEPLALNECAPDIPDALQHMVSLALRKNRDERYQTAAALFEDLKGLKNYLERVKEEDVYKTRASGDQQPAINFASGEKIIVNQSSAEYLIKQIKNHTLGATTALLLLLLAVVGAVYLFGRKPQTIDSVAVLPFVNLSNDINTEYLSDGLADNIINSVSKLSNLKVTSFNTVTRYKGQAIDPQTVGRELKVKAVLLGRLVKQGDTIIISAEFVDTSDGHRLWGEQYNRKLLDILTIEKDIARQISDNLRQQLSGEEKRQLAKNYTENAEAYRLYLQGRYHWNKRSAEGLQQGIEFFTQAIDKDPSYALAYAGLADCYSLLANYASISPQESAPKAKAAAQKALQMDETLAEAHAALGLVKKDYDWDFMGAEKEFERAIQLNPNYAAAYQWRAENLVNLQRLDEATQMMQRAEELDPFSLIISGEVGWVYYQARQFDKAVEQLTKIVEMDRNFPRTYFFLGRVYEQQGKFKEAIEATKQALTLSNNYSFIAASLGHIYATSGQRAEAQKVLAQIEAQAQKEYVSPMAFALVHTALNDKDRAFQWLKKAAEQRDPILIYYLRDPQLENLQSDPRFAELVKQMGI